MRTVILLVKRQNSKIKDKLVTVTFNQNNMRLRHKQTFLCASFFATSITALYKFM